MKICDMDGLSIREHFRTIYVADDERHTVIRDWKLSKLAYNLVLINGASDNRMVCQLQMELIRNFLRR